ncbi:hypothetical protein Agub_g857 [Astrephomene gubernaculifera]|uniref:Tubulin--tyrosine ligase-like protein 9 n=1 Tax=Astrephomene gubernaculifera TaxID=47775 RepID=A0AAD3DEG5_9CHLO|nr:hypothetical protein Agub_g857 [Astrephomene gubernaculifera]
MPQAQWVLDAAYTPEAGQAASNGAMSPKRPRRGPGVLHLDCRGLASGAASKSQAISQQTAQWKPANAYKALSTAEGSISGVQPTHPALLLSVLAGQSAHGSIAGTTSQLALRSGSVGPSSAATATSGQSARTQPTSGPADAANSHSRSQRQQASQGTTAGRSPAAAFTSARVGAISAAAAAAAAAAPRPYAYNPLLPRQSSSTGRRRPSTEPKLPDSALHYAANGNACFTTPGGLPNHPFPAAGPGGSASSSGHGGSRATAAAAAQGAPSGAIFAPTLLQPASSLSAEFLLRRMGSSGAATGASGQPATTQGLLAQGQHGSGLSMAAFAQHGATAEEIAAAASAAIAAAAAAAASSAAAAGRLAPGSVVLTSNGGARGVAQYPHAEPSPNGSVGGSARAAVQRLSVPLWQMEHAERRHASSAGSGGADADSAFEYLGAYEGDAASGEDEAGGEGEEEDEYYDDEDVGGATGEFGCEEDCGEEDPVRGAAAAVVGTLALKRLAGASATLRSSTGGAISGLQHRTRALSSRSLSGKAIGSGGGGRPPAAPYPPQPQPQPPVMCLTFQRPQTRRSPVVAACLSGCSRDGSAPGSEAGSRPNTAASVWSSYDLLQPDPRAPISIRSLAPGGNASHGGINGYYGIASNGCYGSLGGCNTSPSAGVTGFGLRGLRLSGAQIDGGVALSSGGSAGGGGGGSVGRWRPVGHPRADEVMLTVVETRDSDGSGGGAAAASAGRSRCSSPGSSRGSGDGAAAHAMLLLASLGLTSPPSPNGARRHRAPTQSRGGGRKAGTNGGGGSMPPTPTRPLHPAVLALPDLPFTPSAAPASTPSAARGAASAGLTEQQQQLLASSSVPTDTKGRAFPYVLQPAFPGTCPTIAFVGSAAAKQAAGMTPLLNPTLFVKYGGVANTPVRTAFREAGLRPTRKGKRWIVQWGGILDAASLAKLHCFQRVNHFPGTWELGHKGHLYRNVYNARRRARGPAAEAFDIVPRFYIMPRDYEEFRSDSERFPDRLYIQKPTNSSRGRGIRMVTRPDAISRDCKDVLVQHYIANPLLLNGFKFDMRVYAAATCLDPLRLYVFPDGLARLATEPYSADRAQLSKRCVHLTNYSVNKKSTKFVKAAQQQQQGGGEEGGAASSGGTAAPAGGGGGGGGPASECEGSKWSLSGLRAYLEARGMGPGWAMVWRQVCDIIAAAVIAAEPRMNTDFKMKVPHRNNCFEVWGFDIMLTDSYRAWLIEANTCPSLAADSALDMRVKCGMVSELMHLLGVVPYDVEVYEKTAEAKRQARLTGLPVTTSTATAATSASSTSRGGAASATAAGDKGGGGDDEPTTPTTPTPSGGLGTPQHSFGGGGGGSSAGGAAAAAAAAAVQPRTLQELDTIDFSMLSPAELPDIVLDAEAEMARRGSWQRVFPCEEDPGRYLNLFETPRLNNVLLCKYYAQTGSGHRPMGQGGTSEATEALMRRPRPGGSARGHTRSGGVAGGGSGGGGVGGSRPGSREWRPGGGV